MRETSLPEFVWVWNKLQGLATPQLHLRVTRWLESRWRAGDRELLLLAFRNSGKSTLVGLFCAWLLARDPDTRILILAADLALARKMVRNVKRVIETHPLTAGLKPARADQWAADRFTVNRRAVLRDPSMLAKGVSSNLTGSRADVVICDDVEVPNTCDTVPKRADLRARLGEIDYVLVPGGLQLYVGTPHSYYSIYGHAPREEAGEDAPFLSGFRRLELPLLDGHGESRWPERFATEKIEAIRRRSGPNKFASQMMLRPVNISDSRLDPDQIRLYEDELDYTESQGAAVLSLGSRRLVSASCWWDPSYGAPGSGDASVIAALYSDDDGGYWLHRVAYLVHDPDITENTDEATQMCRQVAAFVKELFLPSVTLETNGIGKFLPGLLRRELAAAGVAAAVVEVASHTPKVTRILEGFDAVLAAGALHAHRSVWETPFMAEMREWRPGRNCRDDGLDAVSGCLLSEPVRLRRVPSPGRREWRPGGAPHKARTEFQV
ncbi:MAG: phage terminase large subunit [Alphaproteobacteria bacterium]|nr:phage terminase large subunit [Alphaproteobacteria bacterium]